ncbi:MAG: RES family NAD+ phosphorylase [Proteobacteria bacterium]|nr:RES family NAD+ phosphorylase [Pseudomonadota bacterium]
MFEEAVKKQNRYFRDVKVDNFLQTVLETSSSRKRKLLKNSNLWRAQISHGSIPFYQDGEYIDDVEAPCLPQRMTPLINEALEGRANPKGIPYLYTATKDKTAMAEVRPRYGSLISLGQFKTKKDMILIDCSVYHNKRPICLEEPNPDEREQAVWSYIDNAFSQPVTKNDKMADYVPTQIIAELFKCNGFDGIIYKSMLGEGYNVVLFNVESAKLVYLHLFKVESISLSFKKAGNSYPVK